MVSGDAMSIKEKRYNEIMEKPPRTDIKFDDAVSFLKSKGFNEINKKKGGSHRLFRNNHCTRIINIQNCNGLVKQYQVKQIQEAIEEINNGGSMYGE